MKGHLTEQDMQRYVDIRELTPETLAIISEIHRHVYMCEDCQVELERYCQLREQISMLYEDITQQDQR